MSHHSALIRHLLGLALAGAVLLPAGAEAQPTNDGGVSQEPKLTSILFPGEIIGREQVIRQILRFGTNEFFFVVPEGLRSETAPEGTIVLGSPDQTYYVTIRMIGAPPPGPGLREALLEQIASRFVRASNPGDFDATVAGREGTGFELKQELPKVGSRLIRVLWVPFRAGVMEFALNADARSASDGRGALDAVLLTFRSNESGKLEILRRSDKS